MNKIAPCLARLDRSLPALVAMLPALPAREALVARLIRLVGARMEDELARKLKPHKLNDSEFLTLNILFGAPDGASTPGELCEATSQGATNMTRIANTLVKRKLITREHSADDRRRVTIRITAAGRQFVRQMLPPMFPQLRCVFNHFSEKELSQFEGLLRKLANNLDQLDIDHS